MSSRISEGTNLEAEQMRNAEIFVFSKCADWGYVVSLTKVLVSFQIYLLEFTPSTILLYPPLPIPGIVSIIIIFPFRFVCTHIFTIVTFHTLSPHPPPLTGTTPPTGRTCSTSCSLIL
jgi:hypothetical protein